MNQLELQHLKETCIYINDLQKIKHFYCKVLNLSIFSETKYHMFFKIGTNMLLLFDPKKTETQNNLPPHHAYGDQHFAFEVSKEAYALWKLHLIENDVIIEHEFNWKNGKQSFYFRDPENNLLEIVEPGVWD